MTINTLADKSTAPFAWILDGISDLELQDWGYQNCREHVKAHAEAVYGMYRDENTPKRVKSFKTWLTTARYSEAIKYVWEQVKEEKAYRTLKIPKRWVLVALDADFIPLAVSYEREVLVSEALEHIRPTGIWMLKEYKRHFNLTSELDVSNSLKQYGAKYI